MGMALATQTQVDNAIVSNLRTIARAEKVQRLCFESGRKKITPWITLGLGVRETWLRNILGGARLVAGEWVAELDPTRQDAGCFQISKLHHGDELKTMEAVESGTWQPVIEGATAFDAHMVPSFRAALPFVIAELAASLDFAREHDVPSEDRQRFAIAAHNCGQGGALDGFRRGDVDRNTSGGDYSAWVLDAAVKIEHFFETHPRWLWSPES